MVLTVSSGIGSKIFDRGNPKRVLDEYSYSGEIGHMVVDLTADAPMCDCGGRGHLGAIASGRGVEKLARRMASANPMEFGRSICARLCEGNAPNLNNEHHIVPAALSGDAWALKVIDTSVEPLSQVLLAVTLAIGLEKIVVCGGFALSMGDKYIEILKRALARRSMSSPYPPSIGDLLQLDADDNTCLLGAGAFALLEVASRE